MSRYAGEEGPASGPTSKTFWIFLSASTLLDGSLLRMLDIVIVMSSWVSSCWDIAWTLVNVVGVYVDGLLCSLKNGLSDRVSTRGVALVLPRDRAGPRRDGNADLGLPMMDGEELPGILDGPGRWEGPGICEGPGKRRLRTGEADRPIFGCAGEEDLTVREGDSGRVS